MPCVTIRSEAVFSPCRKFRYWLSKEWGTHGDFGVFWAQNPSNADAIKLDDTTMCCNNFALAWGWRGFGIVNLFPEISPKSAKISHLANPLNDEWILRARKIANVFVIATGVGNLRDTRSVIGRLKARGLSTPFYCLGENKTGFYHPRTPEKYLSRLRPITLPV